MLKKYNLQWRRARNRNALFLTIALTMIAASGCSGPTQWTREQSEAVTTRTYTGVSAAEALKQAETVLQLADPKDTTFVYAPGTLIAQRRFFAFAVIAAASGTYQFNISATEAGGRTTVRTQIFTNLTSTTASIVPTATGAIAVPQSTSNPADFHRHNGTYNLFYSRLDYLLGKSNEWLTCDQGRQRWPTQPGNLGNQPLCLNAQDSRPTSR